jgi:hypothetical protein
MKLFEYLNEQTGLQGNWSIEWNPHRTSYATVKDEIERLTSEGETFFDDEDFINEDDKQRCIDTDTLYVLQWYPETPIGFTTYAASSLEVLEEFVMSANGEETSSK